MKMNYLLLKKPSIMNTKRILFGLLACTTLLAVSCTSNTAEDDSLYENTNSIDKSDMETL